MRKIEAIIKPFRLDEIRDELSKIGVSEIIVTDVRCAYNSDKAEESYLSDDYLIEFLPKIQVEVFVTEKNSTSVIKVFKDHIVNDPSNEKGVKERVFVHEVTEV